MRGGRCLINQCGVLLGHFVHLADGAIDVLDEARGINPVLLWLRIAAICRAGKHQNLKRFRFCSFVRFSPEPQFDDTCVGKLHTRLAKQNSVVVRSRDRWQSYASELSLRRLRFASIAPERNAVGAVASVMSNRAGLSPLSPHFSPSVHGLLGGGGHGYRAGRACGPGPVRRNTLGSDSNWPGVRSTQPGG